MSPYLAAHAAYHSGPPPDCPWATLLDCLLQCGTVISTPALFIMARPCRAADPPGNHGVIDPLQFPENPDCWHIFLAAGDLSALRMMAPPVIYPWVSYFRRDGRLRIIPYATLARP